MLPVPPCSRVTIGRLPASESGEYILYQRVLPPTSRLDSCHPSGSESALCYRSPRVQPEIRRKTANQSIIILFKYKAIMFPFIFYKSKSIIKLHVIE